MTEEEDGPSEGVAKSTLSKFEKGELDDIHYQKTDTSHDAMAESGTVMSTTAKFRAGNSNDHPFSLFCLYQSYMNNILLCLTQDDFTCQWECPCMGKS